MSVFEGDRRKPERLHAMCWRGGSRANALLVDGLEVKTDREGRRRCNQREDTAMWGKAKVRKNQSSGISRSTSQSRATASYHEAAGAKRVLSLVAVNVCFPSHGTRCSAEITMS